MNYWRSPAILQEIVRYAKQLACEMQAGISATRHRIEQISAAFNGGLNRPNSVDRVSKNSHCMFPFDDRDASGPD